MTTPITDDAELDAMFRDELHGISSSWHAPASVAATSVSRRRLQPVFAVLIAIVAASALVVVGLAVHLTRTTAPPSVAPAVTPTSAEPTPPVGLPVLPPPPLGVDLYWAPAATQSIPGETQRLLAYDWTGTERGGLRLTNPLGSGSRGLLPSPRGSRLLIEEPHAYRVIDSRGAMVGALPAEATQVIWSDDEATLCYTAPFDGSSARPYFLYAVRPGGTARRVAPAGAGVFQGPPWVVACSVHSDVALVLTHPTEAAPLRVLVVRLSTGAVLRTLPVPGVANGAPGRWNVVASPDGRLVAVTDDSGARASVFDSSSGAAVGSLPARVNALSADGSRVVTSTNVVDWRTGRVIATPADCCLLRVKVHPGTGELIVGVGGYKLAPPTPPTGSMPSVDSVLIDRAGVVRTVLQGQQVFGDS